MPATKALYVSPERIELPASSLGGDDNRGIYAGSRQLWSNDLARWGGA